MSLPSTKATTATTTHAVVQAVDTYIQNQNLLGEIAELDELLYDLIDLHKDSELSLKRVLQCIYNLLQSNNKYNVKFGPKIFHKLISVVIADRRDDDDSGTHGLRRQLVANVLVCVQIHLRKYPRIDGKFLLRQLWSLSLSSERQPYAAQILVQLFDDFVRELSAECACSIELYTVIKTLLQSELREHRKSAHFLMRKLQMIMLTANAEATTTLSTLVLDSLKCRETHWSSYVTIMETLEEQQSHLVLPTLGTLLPRIASSNQGDEWLSWLRILYVKLLQDNNILVLRWTLSYFFKHFDVAKLLRLNLLAEFLAATNRTQLYNVECNVLPALDVEKFISPADTQRFLEALVTVPWVSVPLHFWLLHCTETKTLQVASYNKNVLLKLSSRVRTLRNSKIRMNCNKCVFLLLEDTIESLTLADYLIFIETLFNASDDFYSDTNRLIRKIKNCDNIKEIVYFSKRCYDIIFGDTCQSDFVNEFIKLLNYLPKDRHGWGRFLPLSRRANLESNLEFYTNQYNVNIEYFQKGAHIRELQQHLMQQLNCQTKDEKSYVMEHCVDWFVQMHLKSWSQLKELKLQPIDLLEHGTRKTHNHLAMLLETIDSPLPDITNMLAKFVAIMKNDIHSSVIAVALLQYAAKNLNDDENEKLLEDILIIIKDWSLILGILMKAKILPNSIVVNGILDGDTSTGDARIEAAYVNKILGDVYNDVVYRAQCIDFVTHQSDGKVSDICDELLRINKELTEKKPRYFENCKEHRIKIRIAKALLTMQGKIKWSDEMWTAVLAPNDQLNISYIYECLVAQLMPSVTTLLDRMQSLASLKPSQQVSIISVVHIYCVINWKNIEFQHLQEIVSLILPHTMGAHYQTRLLAQLVLHRLAVKSEESSIECPILNTVKTSIEITLGSKLHDLQKETRLLLPTVISQSAADNILYMTNTPFDEYVNFNIRFNDKVIEETRTAFKSKRNSSTNVHGVLADTANLNVQRKMNPVNDIYPYMELDKADGKHREQEMIVVASLIDKLPNLGGLARTCEVLGVKTLILAAKSLADKSDFTNLSMTAEKTLNIAEVKPTALAEFLIEKQSLGYKVVGAEQTAQSISFTDFKFPEKCILLLGHEKHGIPVDLIALLDFAVEIPQFGVVRSLNVHVTGSLFIWEYCKQHSKK
ncbi:uncharacterized protein LOC6568114 [Drosophila grimshawi]|uniref:tRNA (guanosine(18)-2'-O)-methyltransferase TARBP1 n=1 Tax=Drosophila grimshawi TaxID=7222 RepID=B4JRC2_DROGR|nr:uncharacterized protein LOC6568114 [Drosophila grimshawi]EDV94312.1 GH20351 [Drosophila grimshawi]